MFIKKTNQAGLANLSKSTDVEMANLGNPPPSQEEVSVVAVTEPLSVVENALPEASTSNSLEGLAPVVSTSSVVTSQQHVTAVPRPVEPSFPLPYTVKADHFVGALTGEQMNAMRLPAFIAVNSQLVPRITGKLPTYTYKGVLISSGGEDCIARKKDFYNKFDMINKLKKPQGIGQDFKSKSFDNICCQLSDTAGQERFRAIMNTYIKNAHFALGFQDEGASVHRLLEIFNQETGWQFFSLAYVSKDDGYQVGFKPIDQVSEAYQTLDAVAYDLDSLPDAIVAISVYAQSCLQASALSLEDIVPPRPSEKARCTIS